MVFDERYQHIRIVNNAAADGTARFENISTATASLHALAACNGGFFIRTPFDPFGLMICDGKSFGTYDRDSWMNGVIVVRETGCMLETTQAFKLSPQIRDALQSGPWLVRDGHSEPMLDQQLLARRTFIARSSRGMWALGSCSACTLQTLAELLRDDAVTAKINIVQGLNLDGGPSTGLWAKNHPNDFYDPEGWAVRNFVAVFPNAPEAP